MPSHEDEDMEKAFDLISKGNELEENSDWWAAADLFGQAMVILEFLSQDASEKTRKEADECSVREQSKIAQLYGRQSYEYRVRARTCFIKAITFENEEDIRTAHWDSEAEEIQLSRNNPVCVKISEEEVQRRCLIFSNLFCKGKYDVPVNSKGGHYELHEDISQKQDSLEERLAELNATLPSQFKNSKERVSEINKGLRRLGVSLYSHEESPSIEVEPSEEEQVQQILSQARDEVRIGLVDDKEKVDSVARAMNETESEGSSVSESTASQPQRKKTKAIKKKLVRAQINLAQLVALLDLKSPENYDSDDDSLNGENCSDRGFDLDNGKSKLIKAQECLEEAMRVWTMDQDDNPS